MKVGIVSIQIPFVTGGAEFLALALKDALIERKINAEIITIPFKPYPPEVILDHIEMAKLLDLSEINGDKIDKIITLKFPAYFCHHTNKTLWLLHQHRPVYDLYDTPYGDLHLTRMGIKIAKKIKKLDNILLKEHNGIYTISQNVADRLQKYNSMQVDDVLYPLPYNAHRFRCEVAEDYIFYPSRFNPIKRQDLIVRAMSLVPDLKLILIGDYHNPYGDQIIQLIQQLNLTHRIILKDWVSEEEKIKLYSSCLAVYNGVFNEDYGYVTIEAFLSSKPVITHPDAGGPLEFVKDEVNGFVVEPSPEAIAQTIHNLICNKKNGRRLGENGKETLIQKNVNWDYVIDRLLANS